MGTLWTEVQLLKTETNLAPNAHAARSVISRMVADKGLMSRREIVRSTGLARSTIEGHLEVLTSCGIIEDGGVGGQAMRGRPAQMFRISSRRVVLVADVHLEYARVAIATLNKEIIATSRIELPVSVGPEVLLDSISSGFEELLDQQRRDRSDACAISVGLPGPVDAKEGFAVRPPHLPGWDGFRVCKAMATRFNCDVVVDNDINLMALGEARSDGGANLPLLMVYIGHRVGGGFVSESGLLLHGAEGAAGDVGHFRVPDHEDSLCACGRRGCVESVASITAISQRVSDAISRDISPDEVIGLLRRGDAATVDIVRGAASLVGRVVADLVNFCNPARVVVGGVFTECTEDFLAQVRSVVYQQAQPLATRNLSILHAALGEEAGLVGGMISAIEQVLSPRGLQYHSREPESDLVPLGL